MKTTRSIRKKCKTAFMNSMPSFEKEINGTDKKVKTENKNSFLTFHDFYFSKKKCIEQIMKKCIAPLARKTLFLRKKSRAKGEEESGSRGPKSVAGKNKIKIAHLC